ncbi:MAG: PstS family phosphate ABC transporter substrate-binding protein [Chloroflexi bacterium]|nr:PstS family phosphate ABC transporter substrate-binding protein [Chloroflexota bacterium]
MRNNIKFLGLVLVLALVLPFSGVLAQDGEEIELEPVDPLAYEGDIAIAGSSTVEPVTIAMAERFAEAGFTGNISVAETGTSAGFERFCTEGSTDLSNASRPIRDSEVEACEAIGRTPLAFKIGTDAITVAVSVENDFVTELKRSELVAIFTGEATMWADVREGWPEEGIELFTPGTDSGTFDFFGEAVLGDDGIYSERSARFDALLAPNPTTSENDFVLVEGIQGSPYAIGYFGFAYYVENQDTLNAVAIADDIYFDDDENVMVVDEADWEAEGVEYVAPTQETAESGDYMLSRPLFIYSAASIMAEKPQVAAFVSYYLSNANEVVAEVGYFPASLETINASKQLFLDAAAEIEG